MSASGDPSADAGFPPGTLIGGKYLVERVLGRGGMGVVLAAHHVQLREPVALKFLLEAGLQKPELVARFEREGRAAVRIKSEHVARVLDVGTHEGAPFMVMELLAGADLHKLSAARGPLPWNEAALYVAQACDAVAEAHLYGIVHRDLKPANLFLTRRADGSPLVKVLDFGISKVLGDVDESLTATTDVLGSPLYMSPEQIESPRDVDARADVWALGAILYKLLTGKAAFAAATAASSLAKIVKDPPPPLRAQRPDVPPDLEAIVLHCLEKDTKARLPGAAELARALLPFAGVGPPDATASGASYSRARATPSRRVPVFAAIAAVLAGAGLAGLWFGGALGPKAAPVAGASSVAAPSVSAAPAPPPASGGVAAAVSASPPPSAEPAASVTAGPSGSASASANPATRKAPTRAPSDAFSDRL